jgi:hypothetical protein
MTKTLLLAALLLAGCGQGTDNPNRTECSIDGLGPVYGEFVFSCAKFAKNFELAKKMFVSEGIIPESEVNSFSSGVPVEIHASDEVILDPVLHTINGETVGYYTFPSKILLSWDGTSLFHELIHHWDFKKAPISFDNFGHKDWNVNGRDAADKKYTNYVVIHGQMLHDSGYFGVTGAESANAVTQDSNIAVLRQE